MPKSYEDYGYFGNYYVRSVMERLFLLLGGKKEVGYIPVLKELSNMNISWNSHKANAITLVGSYLFQVLPPITRTNPKRRAKVSPMVRKACVSPMVRKACSNSWSDRQIRRVYPLFGKIMKSRDEELAEEFKGIQSYYLYDALSENSCLDINDLPLSSDYLNAINKNKMAGSDNKALEPNMLKQQEFLKCAFKKIKERWVDEGFIQKSRSDVALFMVWAESVLNDCPEGPLGEPSEAPFCDNGDMLDKKMNYDSWNACVAPKEGIISKELTKKQINAMRHKVLKNWGNKGSIDNKKDALTKELSDYYRKHCCVTHYDDELLKRTDFEKYSDMGKELGKNLKKVLRNNESFITRMRQGRIDLSEVRRQVSTNGRIVNSAVYRKEVIIDESKLAVSLLIDGSGSMGNRGNNSPLRKEDYARNAMIMIIKAFEYLEGCDLEVRVFTAEGSCQPVEAIIKSFGDEANIEEVKRYSGNSANYDGLAIISASRRLKKHPANKKLMIVVSDGEPCIIVNDSNIPHKESNDAVEFTKEQVVSASSSCRIIGIGIQGCVPETIKRLYEPGGIVLEDVSELVTKLPELVIKFGGVLR